MAESASESESESTPKLTRADSDSDNDNDNDNDNDSDSDSDDSEEESVIRRRLGLARNYRRSLVHRDTRRLLDFGVSSIFVSQAFGNESSHFKMDVSGVQQDIGNVSVDTILQDALPMLHDMTLNTFLRCVLAYACYPGGEKEEKKKKKKKRALFVHKTAVLGIARQRVRGTKASARDSPSR